MECKNGHRLKLITRSPIFLWCVDLRSLYNGKQDPFYWRNHFSHIGLRRLYSNLLNHNRSITFRSQGIISKPLKSDFCHKKQQIVRFKWRKKTQHPESNNLKVFKLGPKVKEMLNPIQFFNPHKITIIESDRSMYQICVNNNSRLTLKPSNNRNGKNDIWRYIRACCIFLQILVLN